MNIGKKLSAIALGAAFAMTGALPAVPALAAGHHGFGHGQADHHGENQHAQDHGHGGPSKDHGKHQNKQGNRQNARGNHGKDHGKQGKNFKQHGPASKDRLKVMRSMGHVTPPQAAVLSAMTLSQGSASSIFAPKTPYTIYTVRIVGPHAHWSGTGSVSVSDNDGSLATPADLYYLPFHRGTMGPDPFSGDQAPYNATTVGQSSSFSVSFVRGQAQFAVFNAQAGSGPIAITVKDAALGQSDTVTYPDIATTTATAAGVQIVGSPQLTLTPGQSATVTFQVTGSNGAALDQSGQKVNLWLAGLGSAAVPAGVTLNGGTPNTASPVSLTTNAQGQVSATLTDVSDISGVSYAVDAALAGSSSASPAAITVTDIPAADAVSALDLTTTPVTSGAVTGLTVPSSLSLTAGGTLSAQAFGAAAGAPVYVEGVNTAGDVANGSIPGASATGDLLSATSSNTSVVSVSGWNAQGETTLNSGVTTLPTITAQGAGTATVTIKDISNPSMPSITLTITVTGQASQTTFEYQGAAIPSTGISLSANTPVPLTVVNTDASGNPVAVSGSTPLTVDVSTTAPNAEILSAIGGSAISSVQIAPGSSSATVYLQSSVAETVTPSQLVASVPQAAAQNIAATETATGAAVTWTAPTTGNPASYQVWEINNTTGVKSDVNANVSGAATSYAVTGLSAGDSYSFNVDAVNAYGTVAKGTPSTAFEYGTAAVSAAPTAFSPNSGSTAGTVTFAITMDKSLPSQSPTAADFAVTDTTSSIHYTVTGVTVSGNVITVTATIPAGTVAAATDSVTITATAGALTDSAGAPSAAIQETTTN